jgi:HEAT repeats
VRPVRRGPIPEQDGNPREYAEYGDARDDLISRFGDYCSYCEIPCAEGPAVEHVQPKGGKHVHPVGKLADICQPLPGAPSRSAAARVTLPQAQQSTAALLQAMNDPAIPVRAGAVRCLGRIGASAAIDWSPIERAAENDPAVEVRAAAMDALVRAGWLEQAYNQDVLSR